MSHRIKLEIAKSMLQHTNLPIKEIVGQLGFIDYNYFLRLFRSQVGLPPAAFRQSFILSNVSDGKNPSLPNAAARSRN
jgi:YesN/AraC family two-component response regulator